jgi:hypothetical protein
LPGKSNPIVSNSFTILPLVIGSFAARRVNETTVLSWVTPSETNTDHFDIERSTDATSWTKIGQVSAAGNSSTTSNYLYVDPQELQEGNSLYYRLKLVSKDLQQVYSAVVAVSTADESTAPPSLNIIPNPLASTMEIKCTLANTGPVEVQFLDITGAILMRKKFTANKGTNVFTFTGLGGLASGVYIVRVIQGGSTVGISKVLKR